MVSDRYVMAKGEAPSGWKTRFDQEIVPAAIDAAAAVEARIETIAKKVRSQPFTAVLCALAVGMGCSMLARPRRRDFR